MSRLGKTTIWVMAVASLAAQVIAEGLADAAKREKERRAKAKSEQPAKTYDDAALQGAVGAGFTQVDGPALTTEKPELAPAKRTAPVPGSKVPPAEAVPMLEKRVRVLERQLADLSADPSTPTEICVNSLLVPPESLTPAARDAPGGVELCGVLVPVPIRVQRLEEKLKQARTVLDHQRYELLH